MVALLRFHFAGVAVRDENRITGALSAAAVEFDYTNWREERHHYKVTPLTVEFGPYDTGGSRDDSPLNWVLHATMLERDGEPRPVGRRTFLIHRLENFEITEPRL